MRAKKELQNQINAEVKEIPDEFWMVFKDGIYKELHRRKQITDAQLNNLIRKR